MLEMRSSLAASAVTVAVGLSIAVAGPAVAAGPATGKSAAAKKAAVKKKAAKKATKKAAPKTVTACVNKKSGATKVLLGVKAKKKCAKGWTKMTWNVAGPAGKNGANGANGATGATGPNGAPLAVRDSTGKRIGGFGGYLMVGIPLPLVQVIADDGGVYTYLDSTGQLIPLSSLSGGGSPLFLDAACAGTAYMSMGSGPSPVLEPMVGGSSRFAYRAVTGASMLDLGPTRAWKLTKATTVVPPAAPTFYELTTTGACTAVIDDPGTPYDDRPQPGDHLEQLAAVVAPPDGVGPLTIG